MTEPIKVALVDDIEQEEAIVIDPETSGYTDPIAIFRTEDDEFYALNDICTHEFASLADGWVEGCAVECPIHTSKFDLRTGEVQNLPATEDARTHKVEVRDGEIWLTPGTSAKAADNG